jgi:hypothetical protein
MRLSRLVLVCLSVASASALAGETLELNARRLVVNSYDVTLVRTSESPATVRITYPSWKARDVCTEYGTTTTTSPADVCGKETVVTRTCDNDGNCSDMYTYPTASCAHEESYCASSELHYVPTTKTLKIKFRSPRKLRGEKQFYRLVLPSEGASKDAIRLENVGIKCGRALEAAKGRIRVTGECPDEERRNVEDEDEIVDNRI